jgi:hypothetical protein
MVTKGEGNECRTSAADGMYLVCLIVGSPTLLDEVCHHACRGPTYTLHTDIHQRGKTDRERDGERIPVDKDSSALSGVIYEFDDLVEERSHVRMALIVNLRRGISGKSNISMQKRCQRLAYRYVFIDKLAQKLGLQFLRSMRMSRIKCTEN